MSKQGSYRVLAIDGGPGSPTYTRQLLDIEHYCQTRWRRSFLASMDMYAGTSDGGWLSLYLASPKNRTDAESWLLSRPGCGDVCRAPPDPDAADHGVSAACMDCVWFPEHPELALQQARLMVAIDFADSAGGQLGLGLFGTVRLISGVVSALRPDPLEKFLSAHYNTDRNRPVTLGELTTDVAIVSLRMGGTEKAGPAIFHNLHRNAKQPPPETDDHLTAVEVAMRTSAFPMFLPLRAGHVDGSVYANNPAMCAIAEILQVGQDDCHDPHDCTLDDIVMLSMGVSDRTVGSALDQALYRLKSLPWGWGPWMLWPTSPLLLMDAMILGADTGVTFQCQQLLRDRFLRVSTAVRGGLVGDFLDVLMGNSSKVEKDAELSSSAWAAGSTAGQGATWDETAAWLESTWLQSLPPLHPPKKPRSRKKPVKSRKKP